MLSTVAPVCSKFPSGVTFHTSLASAASTGSSTTPDTDYGFSFDVLAESGTTVAGAWDGWKWVYTESPGHRRLESVSFKSKGGGLAVISGAVAAQADGGIQSSTYKLQATRVLSGATDVCSAQH